MQSLNWYRYRLASMSPAESVWRMGRKFRDMVDQYLTPRRQKLLPLPDILSGYSVKHATAHGLLGAHLVGQMPTAEAADFTADITDFETWRKQLVEQAEELVNHRIKLFNLVHDYGSEGINWNYEPKARISTPLNYCGTIDYRDFKSTGDCKYVWEVNRHQHLVVLARAYRLTGDQRFADAIVCQLLSWVEQCPFGYGMNWRSPLELAIRLINWVWIFELIEDSEAFCWNTREKLFSVAYRHLWEIDRKYSRFSSANNHLVGEAAGVFIASHYFRGFKNARSWQKRSRDILENEILEQTYPDGGTREQATGYHLFSLEFFLYAGLVARSSGRDFSSVYWDRLRQMVEFISVWDRGGFLPSIGDADDGYVLDLGGRGDPAGTALTLGAVLFDQADWLPVSHAMCPEPVWWLFGADGFVKLDRLRTRVSEQQDLTNIALPQSGYYLLQRGSGQGVGSQGSNRQNNGWQGNGHRNDNHQSKNHRAADSISVSLDCGELGFKSIAAHGHADALSITLRINGQHVLIDPGTYDYFTYPEWRRYFRSTQAHNTIVVDGEDQSEMPGPFMWGRRAQSRCLAWQPGGAGGTGTEDVTDKTDGGDGTQTLNECLASYDHHAFVAPRRLKHAARWKCGIANGCLGGRIVAEHDGYTRLKDPVTHRRTVELDGDHAVVHVVDDLLMSERHEIRQHWHFSEHCQIELVESNLLEIQLGQLCFQLRLDPALSVHVIRGREPDNGGEPDGAGGQEGHGMGWASYGYHQKVPITTVIGTCTSQGPLTLKSCFEVIRRDRLPKALSDEEVPLITCSPPSPIDGVDKYVELTNVYRVERVEIDKGE